MVWIDIFHGFLSICGAALTIFTLRQIWKSIAQMRRDSRALPPEERRANLITGLKSMGIVVAWFAVVLATYWWSAAQWGSRAGATLGIGVFVVGLLALVVVTFGSVFL